MPKTEKTFLQEYVGGSFPAEQRGRYFSLATIDVADEMAEIENSLLVRFFEETEQEFVQTELQSKRDYVSRLIDDYDPTTAYEEGVKLIELLDTIMAISSVFDLDKQYHVAFVRKAIENRSIDHPMFLEQVAEISEMKILGRVES